MKEKEEEKNQELYIYQNKMRCDGNVSLCQSRAATSNNQIVAPDEIHPPRHLFFYLVLENVCAGYTLPSLTTPHPYCTGVFRVFRGQFPYILRMTHLTCKQIVPTPIKYGS